MTSRTTPAQATGTLSSQFIEMFGATVQDVRHALRLFRREPAFTFASFTTLALGIGVNPACGRAFLTGAGAPDDDRVVIVSGRLWRTSLEADPAIVGQSITIDGLSRVVVGVLPPDFTFRPVIGRVGAMPDADVLLPYRWPGNTGGNASLFLLGRLKSGVTQERAEAELTALANEPSEGRQVPSSVAAAAAWVPFFSSAPTPRLIPAQNTPSNDIVLIDAPLWLRAGHSRPRRCDRLAGRSPESP